MNTDTIYELIDKLYDNNNLSDEEFLCLFRLLKKCSHDEEEYLYKRADSLRRKYYDNKIYIRGLIEISNYCKNDCYYCGIRRSNGNAVRYRLTLDEILECVNRGYEIGFRTFVLQGGEDGYYKDDLICTIVSHIKEKYPDVAVTLSIGEKSGNSYKKYFDAGADRYLLRHETANEEHYGMLHPKELSVLNRKKCLYDLKEIGYQVGCGIMVGSPGQTNEHILEDLRFMQKLEPHMIGIGPFIPHKDTLFKDEPQGNLSDTLHLLSILRMIFPKALLPATTALGTIDKAGREKGIQAGANVIMPNLSPWSVREKYQLYNGKIYSGDEDGNQIIGLKNSMEKIGYEVVVSRGDYAGFTKK